MFTPPSVVSIRGVAPEDGRLVQSDCSLPLCHSHGGLVDHSCGEVGIVPQDAGDRDYNLKG